MNLRSAFTTAGRAAALLAIVSLLPATAPAAGKLLQLGTLSALSAGIYQGAESIEPLQKPEAYGLGTFDKLDGEMVVQGGVIYRIGSDGKVTKPGNKIKVPFAAIAVLENPEISIDILNATTRAEFEKLALSKLKSLNYPVLIVVNAQFTSIRTRSCPAQTQPYPPLSEVVANQQKVFDLGEQEGVLVGFYCPAYMSGINAPGFHLHFLNEKHDAGGHVLDFCMKRGHMRLQTLDGIQVILPGQDSMFAASEFDGTASSAKAEGAAPAAKNP
jgi:acetolactate decarboxylase